MPFLPRPWGNMAVYFADSANLTEQPADSWFVSTADNRIFGANQADCALLLLHGTACDSDDWLPFCCALPPNIPLVALDFRGHGHSEIPASDFTLNDLGQDALAVLDALHLHHVVIAGHSLGGMAALTIAQDPRISGLVLLEGWSNLRAAGAAFESVHLYGGLAPATLQVIQQKKQRLVDAFASVPSVWGAFQQSVADFNGRPMLESCAAEVLEMYGDVGKKPDSQTQLDVPQRETIQWAWVEGAGHYLAHGHPEICAGHCAAFYHRLTSPTTECPSVER